MKRELSRGVIGGACDDTGELVITLSRLRSSLWVTQNEPVLHSQGAGSFLNLKSYVAGMGPIPTAATYTTQALYQFVWEFSNFFFGPVLLVLQSKSILVKSILNQCIYEV